MNITYRILLTYYFVPVYLAAGLLFSLPGYAIPITVQPDRNPVSVNESVQLTFSAKQEPDGDPDFSPLYKDFEILNQQRGSNVSMINGDIKRSYTWVLNVMPKNTGKLFIPPISFGSDHSRPSTLVVSNRSPQTDNSNDKQKTDAPLFLKVEATPTEPYVQQQVIYTLKLYRRVGISQAQLTEPELENAVIEKLGEDSNYKTMLEGKSYTVTERKYAIFPQQSGEVQIDPLVLTAQVLTGQRSRFDGFFGSQSTRTQRIRSEAITLNVKAAPDSYNASHWLPAQKVLLQQKWSIPLDRAKVGEPITRTLNLIAKGATVSQLPEIIDSNESIINASGNELKTYPDQPVLKEQPKDNNIISLREEKIAYIPSKAGNYQIPETRIAWWNTETETMETAVLPAQTITAVAAGNTIQPSKPVAPMTETEPRPELNSNNQNPTVKQTEQNQPNWLWMAISLFLALGWLFTVIYFVVKQKGPKVVEAQTQETEASFNIKNLQQACQNNDAQAAKDALIEWGRERFNMSSLGALAKHCPDELKQQISALNQNLYDPDATAWQDGKLLLKAFKAAASQLKKKNLPPDSVLQPLYKI